MSWRLLSFKARVPFLLSLKRHRQSLLTSKPAALKEAFDFSLSGLIFLEDLLLFNPSEARTQREVIRRVLGPSEYQDGDGV